MNIRLLNFDSYRNFEKQAQKELILIKPFPAKLARLYYIPEQYQSNEELIQVLNTLCTCYHKGIYYFRMVNEEDEMTVIGSLSHMNIQAFLVQDNPEYLN